MATVNLQHGTPTRGGGPGLSGDPGHADPAHADPAHAGPARPTDALRAAAAALADLDLDVVALQEVDRGQRRSGYVDQARVLARLLGMPHHRLAAAEVGPRGGPRLRLPLPTAPWVPAYGVALLSRVPVRAWRAWTYPSRLLVLPADHPLAAGGPVLRTGRLAVRRDESRAVLVAELDTPGGPLAVAATHLSTDGAVARAQLADLTARLTRLGGEHLLAGDLNLTPDAVAGATDLAPLAVGRTFPAHRPARQIDHVLGSVGLAAHGAGEVHRLPVADHLTLVAEVTDLRVLADAARATAAGVHAPDATAPGATGAATTGTATTTGPAS